MRAALTRVFRGKASGNVHYALHGVAPRVRTQRQKQPMRRAHSKASALPIELPDHLTRRPAAKKKQVEADAEAARTIAEAVASASKDPSAQIKSMLKRKAKPAKTTRSKTMASEDTQRFVDPRLFERLLPDQQRVVRHKEGPMMVLAGPGTGKSHALVARMLHLMYEEKEPSHSLLALTFTEKSAQLMQERIDLNSGVGYRDVTIRTFHAFCNELLAEFGHEIGLDPQFTVMKWTAQAVFLREHLGQLKLKTIAPQGKLDAVVRALLDMFARLQESNVRPKEYLDYCSARLKEAKAAMAESEKTQSEQPPSGELEQRRQDRQVKKLAKALDIASSQMELAEAYSTYDRLKKERSLMDFQDLITCFVDLLQTRPAVAAVIGRRFRYIMVDEFQDSNPAIMSLVHLLAEGAEHRNIIVVGDDDQAIFAFRGAGSFNFRVFASLYPDAEVVSLTKGFRSYQSILDVARRLIMHNPHRLEEQLGLNKKLVSVPDPTLPPGAPSWEQRRVQSLCFRTGADEVEGIAFRIRDMLGVNTYDPKSGQPPPRYDSVAVLVRMNWDVTKVVEALNHHGIPTLISGGGKLFMQSEIKLLMSFLQCLVSPTQDRPLYDLMSSPMYGMDPHFVARIVELAQSTRVNLRDQVNMIAQMESQKQDKSKGPAMSETADDAAVDEDDQAAVKRAQAQMRQRYIASVLASLPDSVAKTCLAVVEDLRRFEARLAHTGVRNIVVQFMEEKNVLENCVNMVLQNGAQARAASSLYGGGRIHPMFLSDDADRDLVRERVGNNIARFLLNLNMLEQSLKTDRAVFVLPHLSALKDFGEDPEADGMEITDENAVQVMTIHKAKGLEFDTVFLMGALDSRLPGRHRRPELILPEELMKVPAVSQELHEQEERRLVYVALTRARHHFIFTWALHSQQAAAGGSSHGGRVQKRSRFVAEALGGDYPDDTIAMSRPAPPKPQAQPQQQLPQWQPPVPQAQMPMPVQMQMQMQQPVMDSMTDAEQHSAQSWQPRKKFKIPRMSYSRADVYLRCPKRYEYQYILEYPSPSTVPMAFGSSLHKGVEEYGISRSKDEPFDVSRMHSAFEEEWKGNLSVYKTPEEAGESRERGKKLLNDFAERSSARDSVDGIQPLMVEQLFALKLPLPPAPPVPVPADAAPLKHPKKAPEELSQVPAVESASPTPAVPSQVTEDEEQTAIDIIGYWDRVDRVRDQGIVIREFKTRITPYLKKGLATNRQLMLYAAAYETIYGESPSKVVIESITDGSTLEYIPNEEDATATLNTIRDVAMGIKNGKFPARPSFLECKLCPFSSECPHAATRSSF